MQHVEDAKIEYVNVGPSGISVVYSTDLDKIYTKCSLCGVPMTQSCKFPCHQRDCPQRKRNNETS